MVACGDTSGLVAAVAGANGSAGPTTITLAKNCTYVLNAPAVPGGNDGLPVIVTTLTINGNGSTIARSAAPSTPNFRIIEIGIPNGPGGVPAGKLGSLTLNDLTVTGGRIAGIQDESESSAGGDSGYGGGILVKKLSNSVGSSLVLNHVTVSHNSASDGHRRAASFEEGTKGGGVAISVGRATITDSTISDNTASDALGGYSAGGGIANTDGTLVIRRSRIAGNHSVANGFPIGAYAGAVESDSRLFFHAVSTTIEDSVIAGNDVTGIAVVGSAIDSQREFVLTCTVIAGNVASASGDNSPQDCVLKVTACNSGSAYAEAAVVNQGHMVITDSLITANRATATGSPHALVESAGFMNSGGFAPVGSFLVVPGKAEVVRTLIVGNVAIATGSGAETRGAGIANTDQGLLDIQGGIVSGNTTSLGTNPHGGGIDNYVRPKLEHPELGRVLGTVALHGTTVTRNSPHNCEPLNSIAGCSG